MALCLEERFMIFCNLGLLKIYKILVNMPSSVHLNWFTAGDVLAGIIFQDTVTQQHTHKHANMNFSCFFASSLQLGPVPPGFWDMTLSPFITVFLTLLLSQSLHLSLRFPPHALKMIVLLPFLAQRHSVLDISSFILLCIKSHWSAKNKKRNLFCVPVQGYRRKIGLLQCFFFFCLQQTEELKKLVKI